MQNSDSVNGSENKQSANSSHTATQYSCKRLWRHQVNRSETRNFFADRRLAVGFGRSKKYIIEKINEIVRKLLKKIVKISKYCEFEIAVIANRKIKRKNRKFPLLLLWGSVNCEFGWNLKWRRLILQVSVWRKTWIKSLNYSFWMKICH